MRNSKYMLQAPLFHYFTGRKFRESNTMEKSGQNFDYQQTFIIPLIISKSLGRVVYRLKGAGGVFEFSGVSDRGECQLPDAFYRIKKYCSQPKLSDFEILKIWVITVRVQTLNAISQRWTFLEFKNPSSPSNFETDH